MGVCVRVKGTPLEPLYCKYVTGTVAGVWKRGSTGGCWHSELLLIIAYVVNLLKFTMNVKISSCGVVCFSIKATWKIWTPSRRLNNQLYGSWSVSVSKICLGFNCNI